MSKRKKKTERQKLEKKLDMAWKIAVKERDEYICQKCGKSVESTNCHASHVIPRSWGKRVRWELNNGKVLCFHCHMNWWHKNPTESGLWFKDKFPDRYEYLMEIKKLGTIKYSLEELEELLEELTNY